MGTPSLSRAAVSVLAFATYLGLVGLWLVLAPDTLLGWFGFEPPEGVWVRVVGMLMLILAFYYTLAARHELTRLLQWTVYARASVILFFAGFVTIGAAEPVLLLFGVIDLLAATWTHLALRADRRESARTVDGPVR